MFKGKAIQVKMVRPETSTAFGSPQVSDVERISQVEHSAKAVIREGGKIVVAFVVLDTFRRVLVELAKKK